MRLRFLRAAALALLPLALASCSYLPFLHHHPASKPGELAKARFPAHVFVRSLTLAQLSAALDVPDKEDIHRLETYTAQAPIVPATQTVLVLKYKDRRSGEMQALMAPILEHGAHEWRDVLWIMHRVAIAPYTLSDSTLAVVTVAPVEALALHGNDNAQLRDTLGWQQQQLLDTAERLPALDDVRLQLRLAGFFIDHRFRDAAYISVDNMKRLLAGASTSRPEDAAEIQALSRQLATLEGRLHKALPFTFPMPGSTP